MLLAAATEATISAGVAGGMILVFKAVERFSNSKLGERVARLEAQSKHQTCELNRRFDELREDVKALANK